MYLVYVLSNVSTVHNSAKPVLYIECTEKLYAEQGYYVLVIIKLAKLLVNSFGYLYNEKGQAKLFFSEGHWAVTITEVYPPYRLGKNSI